jgi:hypothetical protein
VHVLARGSKVVVYERGARLLPERGLYACKPGRAGTTTLVTASRFGISRVGRVAVAGEWVAFSDGKHSIDSGCTSVQVVEVTPHPLRRPARVAGCTVDAGLISSARVIDLVVSARGSVAWILAAHGRGQRSDTFSVIAAEGAGSTRVLDPAGAQPGSLRLSHGVLSWRDATGVHSSHLA